MSSLEEFDYIFCYNSNDEFIIIFATNKVNIYLFFLPY